MKRALITGGSGAIGAAISQRLAADGFHVIIHANNNLQTAEQLGQALREQGHSAEAVQFDVADAAATAAALEALLEQGPVQVLVNNAGIHDDAVFPGMQPAQWYRVIDVSLHGFFNVTQPLTMPMIRTRWGRIINITSVAALAGNRGQTNYAAAKSALHGATKSLSIELASRGITVNAVAPGIIESEMSKDVFDKEMVAQMVPMKRVGKPEEVASLVGFLASEHAGYITGQVISINGGMI
ncbi:3-oxoacyl-ACP reductase FabG [Pseudogulbenkiania subflava]|uniref:3-oxoacyl-[acyl-carrier protein] reductase n=1 Tax=Pseudogulbenkiania subflava DSM 22618 TaxID=1123014 RepID=A0A1Y6BSJ0_9NEIS|nr:3-oxoacyl-ACP reductase FabG [Pseudogulbenkiania subflava]SMF25871.1 3-oxoacyl-[acyl-carrier protein] reductase [Pseudogulbenkiania subflava DSM 22618]